MAPPSPEDIYWKEMGFFNDGMAMWQADPLDEYPEVQVGDAGYIACV